jgi:hypothetical protein
MLITVFTWRLDWMWQRFLRQFGLQLILLIGTLIAVELILRAIDLRELRYGYRDGYPVVFRYDPEIGWLPVANRITTFEGSKLITVRSNSFGLRDIEHDASARPTVMFVGDSLVWGYDVEESERFTELLRDWYPGIRIVNAGVNAYGTDQEYLLLRRLWRAFNPDVVVLIFCVDNDHRDNSTNINAGYFKPYLEQAPDGSWKFSGQPVTKSRNTYFTDNPLVRNLWLARAAVTGYVHFRYPKVVVPDPTEQLIKMTRDFVAGRGAKFFVGLQRDDARLEAFLRAEHIPYTSFEGAEIGDGIHWTPSGHRVVSARLKSFLEANGVLALPNAASAISPPQDP